MHQIIALRLHLTAQHAQMDVTQLKLHATHLLLVCGKGGPRQPSLGLVTAAGQAARLV